jgi:hypothetical protein
MTWDPWVDLLDLFLDSDSRSSVLGGLRDKRPDVYHGVLIGIVVILALLVYLLLW